MKRNIILFFLALWCTSAWGQPDLYADVTLGGIYYNLNNRDFTASVTFEVAYCRYSNGVFRYKYYSHYKGVVDIPEKIVSGNIEYTVVAIENNAFTNSYYNIDAIIIPKTVTFIGLHAFDDSSIISSIEVSEENPNYLSENGVLYNKDKTQLLLCPQSISGQFVIPEEVSYIGSYAFSNCDGLTSVTIPNSVTSIGCYAFSGCNSLTSIAIPDVITTIDSGTFCGCSNLTSVTIPDSVKSIGDAAFWDCCKLISINIPDSVKSIGTGVFHNCSSLTSVAIPNAILSIPDATFRKCSSLTSVTIPDSVKSIGYSAFNGCQRLGTINLPNKLTTIGDSAFYGAGLESIKLPRSVINIGEAAFKLDDSFVNPSSFWIYCYPKLYSSGLLNAYSDRLRLYGVPAYSLVGYTTQTTLQLTFKQDYFMEAPNGENLAVLKYGWSSSWPAQPGESESSTITLENLRPNTEYTISPWVLYSDSTRIWLKEIFNGKTKGLNPNIKFSVTPTSLHILGEYDEGDAHVSETALTALGKTTTNNVLDSMGLDPNKGYYIVYTVKTKEGSTETINKTVSTPVLELTTLQPKCVSNTCAIVAATTNISEDERGAGFQWKKYDAPESLAPTEGYAVVYEGKLEGRIKNLQSTSYYNVRAFYKSAAGNYQYGEWTTFDPSDFSYFDPTVHTYPTTETTATTANVRAYVLAGTDAIVSQGFEYWETDNGMHNSKTTQAELVPAASQEIMTAIGTGQVMQVELNDLKPSTTYAYRAFVTTGTGTTYGEEQSFTTAEQTGIGGIYNNELQELNIVGYYDLFGRRLSERQRGVNIIRYSNGTSRKIIVK